MNAGTSTIAAIASPPGPGARGIVRLSGPRTGEILGGLWVGDRPPFAGRAAYEGRIFDGRGEQPARCLWMPGPRSFTREDVGELHLYGAPPLVGAAYARVLALGAEPAPPGEFTRRAFLSGRIDLLRAEGVLSLVSARSEAERRAGAALLFGGLSERIEALRDGLEETRALVEASLDFDESDTGHVPDDEIEARTRAAGDALRDAAAWETQRGAPLAEPRVVLFGAPNAGKSSLYNRLVEDDVGALVSDVPGTTRDTLGARWRVPGGVVRLVDTAGLEEGGGVVGEAQGLGRVQRESADLVLWVVDVSRADWATMQAEQAELGDVPHWPVWSRADLVSTGKEGGTLSLAGFNGLVTSAQTGEGLDSLSFAVGARFFGEGSDGEGALGEARQTVRELGARHRRALERALEELDRARAGRAEGQPLDLFAAGLRAATDELDAITGRTTPDDVLDRVFARFCIGK